MERAQQIKDYLCTLFAQEDEHLQYAREHSKEAGLPEIAVPAHVGKLLYLLAKLRAPKRILEIGLLGGYSTLWLLRALPADGKLISLEIDPERALIAQEHVKKAGFESQFEVRVGAAYRHLVEMRQQDEEPFDLIFIDADKENYPRYLDAVLPLSRSGTLILSDNLIPKRGEVLKPDHRDVEAIAIYEFNQKMANHPNLDSTLLTTVWDQGRIDGLGLAIVR